MVPWAHPIPHPKRHLDWFKGFCRAHDCDRDTNGLTDGQTDRQTDELTNQTTPSVTINSIYVAL